jgi:hypothetical protein
MHLTMRTAALALLLFSFHPNVADAQLRLVDVLEALYPDSNDLSAYTSRFEAAYPSGTVADVHLILPTRSGETFSVSARYRGRALPLSVWSRLVDVPVEQNTGLDSRTERFKGNFNPHVIRRAPFRVYEAIRPLDDATQKATNAFTALRLSIPASLLGGPGRKEVEITVKTGKAKEKAVFIPTVYGSRPPGLSDSRFFYTNWFSLSDIETRHGVERWSDDWFRVLDRYAALMAYGRQNAILIPGELFSIRDGAIRMDADRMKRYIDLFRAHGFRYFESPHVMDRGKEDAWGDPILKVSLTGVRYDTELGKRQVDTIAGLVRDFTRANGLTGGQWLQHISDEPTDVQAACYGQVVKRIKSIFPEAVVMEATNARGSLTGAVDFWCPLINDFQVNESFFRERERNGEKVIVYTCLIPGGPWLNRLLDQQRIRPVYFGWGAARYGISGFLHWGLNQYRADPWKQSVVKHPSPVATTDNFLPAGDTHVVYPGESGPLSSTRFEAHRLGIEDFELLETLRLRDPKRMDALVSRLFRTYTDYETSLSAYRSVRRELLEALAK